MLFLRLLTMLTWDSSDHSRASTCETASLQNVLMRETLCKVRSTQHATNPNGATRKGRSPGSPSCEPFALWIICTT